MSSAASSAASDESHLWLRGASAFGYTHYVAAVSNKLWPVASFKPQVAVCGFFLSLEDATAFAAQHQRYKDEARTIPHGPIFLTLECGRLFPLALSPRRLFGDQSAATAKKRDAVVRNYYRRREAEALEVQRRSKTAQEASKSTGETEAAPPSDNPTAAPVDERTRRAITRRARRQAWELLQRLYAQKEKLRRAAHFIETTGGGGGADGEMDDEMADLLEKLTPEQRKDLVASQKAAAGETPATSQSSSSNSGAAGAAAGSAAEEGGTEEFAPRMDINPAPNTRMGSIDEYIAWAEKNYRRKGIVPASNEMMDAEEREQELRELAKERRAAQEKPLSSAQDKPMSAAATAAAAAATTTPTTSAASHGLPQPPAGQAFCIGAIYYDDAGTRMNKDCPQAQNMEHVVTFMSAHETNEAAKKALEAAYAPALKQENLFFVRTGVWCCFDHVAEDDGVHVYREDLMGEMLGASTENEMLRFVEKALEQNPDKLPIPTAEA